MIQELTNDQHLLLISQLDNSFSDSQLKTEAESVCDTLTVSIQI